ncbi:THAP domain-containing protein, partial [Ooceraea biroi]
FHNCLPHSKTLSKWYSTINASPGLSVEVLKMIRAKAKNFKGLIVCALIMDEMAIRNKVEFERKAFVFIIVAINNTWKCPGYFFINGLEGTQKMNLVTHLVKPQFGFNVSLKALFDCDASVISLTFDGYQSHFVMAHLFRCSLNLKNMKPSFEIANHTVQVLPDLCRTIKLVRNIFGDKKIIIDENGNYRVSHRKLLKLISCHFAV